MLFFGSSLQDRLSSLDSGFGGGFLPGYFFSSSRALDWNAAVADYGHFNGIGLDSVPAS